MRGLGRRRIATALVLGAVALGAGGCFGGGGGGGGQLSKSDYTKKLRSVGKDVQGLSSISSGGGSQASKFSKLRAGLRKAADQLDKVKPPSDVKADNDKLVSGLRELADAVGPVEKAAKAKDVTALQAALGKLQRSGGVTKLRDAISDLRSKGYNLGS